MLKIIRIIILLFLDILIINVSYIISFLIRFDFDVNSAIFDTWLTAYADNMFQITAVTLAVFAIFGLYTNMWRYAGVDDLIKIVLSAAVSCFIVSLYMNLAGVKYIPGGIYAASFFILSALISAFRLSSHFIRGLRGGLSRKPGSGESAVKVMVVGAGDAGAAMIKEIKSHPEYGRKVVVAVDDDPSKAGSRIAGVKIAGGRNKIRLLTRKYSVKEIIITVPSANNKVIQGIVNECNRTACKIRILPGLIDIISDKVSISKLRDVSIEDLLGYEAVKLNAQVISGYLERKVVMVSGGGGSIGSELCRQIVKYKPRRIVALDIYENTVFELANEVRAKFPGLEFEIVIASVRNRERLDEIFKKYRPHVIFHAATHKHVPLMEKNPKEAVLNNILGTKNMLDMSDKYAAEKFIMISTDRAANPVSVVAATQRAAEMILQEKSGDRGVCFSAVRFGNLLGSSGSVLPIFRKQIEAGGPVTVTHAEMRRCFMPIPEAAQLVLQAGAMAEGGEIFTFDMGEPIKIMDLAENIIKLSGYMPGIDIDIAVTGLRPGEDLYEELTLDEKRAEKTAHGKIYLERSPAVSGKLKAMLESDESFVAGIHEILGMTDGEIKEWLKELTPGYKPA